ncbi:MAG: hypothetical protein ACI31M_03895 [Bacilli bacterium]
MNRIVRKSIYIVIYICIIGAFIFIGTRDYQTVTFANDQEKFSSEYKDIPKDNRFEYLNYNELISMLENGTGIIFIGDKDNTWSVEYANQLYEAVNFYNIPKVYYYDAKRIKDLKNSSYYAIINELEGNLITTDTSTDNLFTPSLYFVKDGEVKYYDTTSAVVKNGENPKEFWTLERITNFKQSISDARELIIDKK